MIRNKTKKNESQPFSSKCLPIAIIKQEAHNRYDHKNKEFISNIYICIGRTSANRFTDSVVNDL